MQELKGDRCKLRYNHQTLGLMNLIQSATKKIVVKNNLSVVGVRIFTESMSDLQCYLYLTEESFR